MLENELPENDPSPETSDETEGETSAPRLSTRTSLAPTSILQKESDRAARPGFRSPANSKTKAQQKASKGKK